MTNRIFPAPDKSATCPLDGKVLEYYAPHFESVFVMLHPFIRPVSISKDLFNPGSYPDRATITNGCEPVRWVEVVEFANLPSLDAIDVGLRTQIGALRAPYANEEFSDAINLLYDVHDIVPPDEGRFSDLQHDQVLQSLQNIGQQWAWVGDEFDTERKLYWIDDLKQPASKVTSGRCNVFTPDKSLLWTTHWDSHFSFLCGSREVLDSIVRDGKFEGFFCDENSEVYWSL